MAHIDPKLVTFVSGVNDLLHFSDSFSRLGTPYFAINVHLETDPNWYLLTLRDMIRFFAKTDKLPCVGALKAKSDIVDSKIVFLDHVKKNGQPLVMNKAEAMSLLLANTAKPREIKIAEPSAGSLAIRNLIETVSSTEVMRPKRRTRKDGSFATANTVSARESTRLTRIPHMRFFPEGSIAVGMTFDVNIVANLTPQGGDEESDAIILEDLTLPVDIEVRLETSSHLKVESHPSQPLTIDPARDSTDELTFKVKALRSTPTIKDRAYLTAYFTHAKRPCGLVRRRLSVAPRSGAPGQETPLSGSESSVGPPASGRLEVLGGKESDLLVIVRNPSQDLRNFEVEVRTELVSESEYDPGPVEWTFNDVTPKIVLGMFKGFEAHNQSQSHRYAQLLGAGSELWGKAPRNFVDLFWKLIDQGKPLTTICVVSEEPYIPWELMEPFRYVNSVPEFRDLPLGVEFTVARWTSNDMVAAPQKVSLVGSRVVAPRYKVPLEHAEEEVQVVLKSVPGQRIDPADFAALESNLGLAQASLLHFACHGVAHLEDEQGERLIGVQAIQLEGTNQVLDSRTIRGMKSFRKFFRQRPLVILNACEVGQPAPSLNGIGGLASSFIDLGAAGVIAPLWSVDDQVAFKVATALYEALSRTPAPTFAEVMRSIRARAYVGSEQGTDSYAAYCFYGDPLARPA